MLLEPVNNQVPLLQQLNNVCPDKTVCTANNTCCKKDDGTYSCCSASNGVCCQGNKFCCPKGYQCDITNNNCLSNMRVPPSGQHIEFFNRNPSHEFQNLISCPDKTHCATGQTCCGQQGSNNGGGGFGCCALPNAVCCSNKRSCCPAGSTCDEKHGLCLW